MTPDTFAFLLREYCHQLGGSVTSWGRTDKHNAAVGGAPRSLHLAWKAADVVYDEPVPLERAQTVARALNLYVYREADHDHVRPIDETWV